MADTKNKNQYINVSPLDKKTQKSINQAQLDQKKAEEKTRNSKEVQRGIRESNERLAAQENRRREEINKIIKEQGYYNGPNGEHYEKKLKKVKAKDIAAQNRTKIVKPTKTSKMGLLNRLAIAIARGISNIKNFFANLFQRKPEAPEYDGVVANGNPLAGMNKSITQKEDPVTAFDRDAMQLAKDLYRPEEKTDIVNAKKEMQYWMNRQKINDKAPRDVVFDFMKAATLQSMVTDEKGMSEILTYAMENKCEYQSEKGNTLMYFQLQDGQVGVIGVSKQGNIFVPADVVIGNTSTQNPITVEKLDGKMPEKVVFLAEQIKQSPNLLQQFTNEDGFSRDSLQQVREYLENKGVNSYDQHLAVVEQNFVDRNAIRAFNEFVTRASYMGNLEKPDDVIAFGLIKPAQTMSQMSNPGQYSPVFEQACDQLIKGLSQEEAMKVAETLLVKKGEELAIVPRETQEILVAHIDELQRHGIAAPEVVSIIQSYNQSTPQMAEINKQLISLDLRSGVSIQDMLKTPRETEVNIAAIANHITNEISTKSRDTIADDVRNGGNSTISGIYLANLKQSDVLLVAQQMPEGDTRDSFMVIAGLSNDERTVDNNEIADNNSTPVIEDDDIAL